MSLTAYPILLVILLGAVIGAPADEVTLFDGDLPATPPDLSTEAPTEGCPRCNPEACPRTPLECSAGNGFADDPCGCCREGVCGLPDGAKCFAEGLGLPVTARMFGACGENMDCVLRQDLKDTDEPEALCVCREQGAVCGSDNSTYSSVCRLKPGQGGQPSSNDIPAARVWLKHRGHCRAAPWIVTAPTPVNYHRGSGVSLECEVKGYPAPTVSWEKVGSDSIAKILPGDDAQVVVLVRGGPETFMASSWLQIMELRDEDVATYVCVATNSEGEARAGANVTLA